MGKARPVCAAALVQGAASGLRVWLCAALLCVGCVGALLCCCAVLCGRVRVRCVWTGCPCVDASSPPDRGTQGQIETRIDAPALAAPLSRSPGSKSVPRTTRQEPDTNEMRYALRTGYVQARRFTVSTESGKLGAYLWVGASFSLWSQEKSASGARTTELVWS